MGMPKSVTKVKKSGVEFVSSVDRCKYTLKELERAALRDSAKFLKKDMRKNVSVFRRILIKNIASWVRKTNSSGDVELQYGFYTPKIALKKKKIPAFHIHLNEFGSIHMKANPTIKPAAVNNISTLRDIQGQYLSRIEDIEKAKKVIDEDEEVSDE